MRYYVLTEDGEFLYETHSLDSALEYAHIALERYVPNTVLIQDNATSKVTKVHFSDRCLEDDVWEDGPEC
ncbi:MAG: hypothetical protein D6735_15470 [Acidobacteria bacterium]|nr:MAG: hypothetical protein D6735_15470 [Acidobacteriota bacterium]